MKTSSRLKVRILVESTRAGVSSRGNAARTFVSSSSVARQEEAAKQSQGAAVANGTSKLNRAPIAWATATTFYSHEAKAFASGQNDETIDSYEVIPDEKEEPSPSLIARSKVKRGVIVECRRSVSHSGYV